MSTIKNKQIEKNRVGHSLKSLKIPNVYGQLTLAKTLEMIDGAIMIFNPCGAFWKMNQKSSNKPEVIAGTAAQRQQEQ